MERLEGRWQEKRGGSPWLCERFPDGSDEEERAAREGRLRWEWEDEKGRSEWEKFAGTRSDENQQLF